MLREYVARRYTKQHLTSLNVRDIHLHNIRKRWRTCLCDKEKLTCHFSYFYYWKNIDKEIIKITGCFSVTASAVNTDHILGLSDLWGQYKVMVDKRPILACVPLRDSEQTRCDRCGFSGSKRHTSCLIPDLISHFNVPAVNSQESLFLCWTMEHCCWADEQRWWHWNQWEARASEA